MPRKLLKILIFVTAFLSTVSLALAQTDSNEVPEWVKNTKISGLVFGDYYWVATHHNPDLKDKNGFWLRRVYLTFDHQLEKNLSARVRFEAASPGDFKSSDKIVPFVKHLYLNWKVNNNHSLYFGLSGPPTFGVVEEVWGYRSVEKTPLDLYLFAPSSDFGAAVKGRFNKHFKYHGMVANGSGTGAETNSGKRAMFSLGYYPDEIFLVEGYVDTESRSGNENRQTYQIFSAIKGQSGRGGFLLTRINRNNASFKDNFDIASVFVVSYIDESLKIVGRYDWLLDLNPDGEKIAYLPISPKAKSNLVLLGLDWQAAKNLNFIPNIEYAIYDTDGTAPAPRSDFIPRFTLYFTF